MMSCGASNLVTGQIILHCFSFTLYFQIINSSTLSASGSKAYVLSKFSFSWDAVRNSLGSDYDDDLGYLGCRDILP
ncbi:hypothetical protein VNO77_18154 [Canavalia gladiata]|uniref:Uncharacterized protein n=1 Tax=Canavalia gladiata TaxID=3824 RepID=A0AAN9LKB0_CANGL